MRGRVLAAKVVAGLLAGIAAIVLSIGLAALATVVSGTPHGFADFGLVQLGKFAILQLTGVLQGLAFGLLFLSSAPAIVSYFVFPTALNIVGSLWAPLGNIQPWIDLWASQAPLFDVSNLSDRAMGADRHQQPHLGRPPVPARPCSRDARRGEVANAHVASRIAQTTSPMKGEVMKQIEAVTEIDAPAKFVWAELTAGSAYADWNPFMTQLDGELRVGGRLEVRIAPPGGRAMTFRPTVTVAKDGERLEWLGRLLLAGIFDGRHSFLVQDLGGGRTRLTQAEIFSGLLVPLTGKTLERTRIGFAAMNQALRIRAEKVATQTEGASAVVPEG